MEGAQTYGERSSHWNVENTIAEDKSQDTTSSILSSIDFQPSIIQSH